jgi:hypothetical protein
MAEQVRGQPRYTLICRILHLTTTTRP